MPPFCERHQTYHTLSECERERGFAFIAPQGLTFTLTIPLTEGLDFDHLSTVLQQAMRDADTLHRYSSTQRAAAVRDPEDNIVGRWEVS